VIAELDGVAITLGNKRVAVPWFESDFYICGPELFESTLASGLVQRGARKSRIFVERFHSNGAIEDDGGVATAEVVFSRSGTSATWTEAEGLTLLELAEKAGLAPPSGCRIGVCSSCQCELLDGDVRYEFRPIAEAGRRNILLCCAKPATGKLVLAL
jgi:ferredoxin